MHYEYKNGKLVTDDPNPPEWWKRGVHFVEVDIPSVKWMSGCGEVLPEWKVFETREEAVEASSKDSKDNHGFAKNVAYYEAEACEYENSGCEDAWEAALNAACDSYRVQNNTWDDLWCGAEDAALMAKMHMVDVADENYAHATKRWDAWMRGYGVLCDVDGALYVYKRV